MGSRGLEVLSHILQNELRLIIFDVVIGRDNNIKDDFSNEIIAVCTSNDINYYERGSNPNYIGWGMAISWRWLILNQDKLIIFHDSILPAYRGFAPLVTALKNGDREIGVTAILANEKYDEGEIVSQSKVVIDYPIRINEAIKRVTPLYIKLVEELFIKISNSEKLDSVEQDHSKATYSLWLDSNDYFVNWQLSADEIERHVYATGYPYSGAMTHIDDELFIITSGEAVKNVVVENRVVGKVIFMDNDCPIIVCGKGLYKITEMVTEDGVNALPLRKFRSRLS